VGSTPRAAGPRSPQDDHGGRIATIATLVVDVVGNTTGLNSSLTKAQGNVAGFGSIAGKAAAGVGIALAAVGVAAIKAASDLGESLNKAQVVFGSAQKSVVDFSETTAESLGISQSAALEAAAGFGAMAQSAGLSETASASLSIDLVKLAGDMASFNNQDPTEMLERLRGGLAGEAEPLRKFGVFISEARVETEAFATGIAKAGDELTDAQKVQARFNIIMQDTKKQQGDFARTVGTSLPNQLRVLKAELIDTAASLGKQLLPAVLDLAKALKDMLPVIVALLDPLIDLIQLGAQALAVLGKLLTLNFDELSSGFEAASARMARLFQQFDSGKITIIELENELLKLRQETGLQTEVNEAYSLALAQARDNVDRMKQAQNEWNAVQRDTAGATNEAADSLEKLNRKAKEIKQSIAGELPAIIGTVTKMKDAFSITPHELVEITRTWAQIGKRIARDLELINEVDLKPAIRDAILQLPPEMRDAFARGNAQVRGAIIRNIKTTLDIQETIPGLAADALRGGAFVGKSLMTGTIKGIIEGSPAVAAASARAVQQAIDAAKAAARAESPSKKMMELGQDLVRGLIEGMEKDAQKAVDAATKLLQKVLDAASSFRGAIRSGFAQFGDISGAFGTEEAPVSPGSIQDFFASQAALAEQFAAVLSALARQGASKGLLAQIAGGGAEAIPFAQALLQGGPALIKDVNESLKTIADAAGDVSERLTKSFFGEKIDELRDKVGVATEELRAIKQELRHVDQWRGGDINIQVNGQTLAKITRDEINKLANRNAGTTVG